MLALIIGLALFLGLHSIRIVADDWRSAKRAAIGEKRWKGIYSLASLVGLVLIIWGYGLARQSPVLLYSPPLWTRHASSLLTLIAFILFAAAEIPRNHIRVAVGHPMVVGTKLWAFAHLIANGTLADLLLFGSFLIWSVVLFRTARQRDRLAGSKPEPGQPAMTVLSVVAGVVVWAAVAFWLHGALIGVRPFG